MELKKQETQITNGNFQKEVTTKTTITAGQVEVRDTKAGIWRAFLLFLSKKKYYAVLANLEGQRRKTDRVQMKLLRQPKG